MYQETGNWDQLGSITINIPGEDYRIVAEKDEIPYMYEKKSSLAIKYIKHCPSSSFFFFKQTAKKNRNNQFKASIWNRNPSRNSHYRLLWHIRCDHAADDCKQSVLFILE